jgi:hypothetical protein
MNANTKAVRATAQMKLGQKIAGWAPPLTSDDIRKVVLGTIEFFGCEDVDAEALVADLEASFQTVIGIEHTLLGKDEAYAPWLDKRKAEITWKFWDRYQQYLLQEKRWPQATLERLDESTDRVLGLLTAPDRAGAWDRRGMVVGHVQSGKTANYVGIISKAADAGYKLIVVLAGFHKSLRSQTQIRLEEGFLGYDRGALPTEPDAPVRRIGVGLIDPTPRADSITTRADDGDFKRQVAKNFAINPGGHPLLFVVKKNGSVLQNLLGWVRWAASAKDEHGKPYVRDVPLLVIDDEADQGSIDTKQGAFNPDGTPDRDHDPAVLNRRIRELLHLFEKSAYVGYTATPFANIFIHEQGQTEKEGEDLFPRSFIVSLPTPSSYVGPAEVFGYENEAGESVPGLPIIRVVEDHAASAGLEETAGWMPPKHRIDHVPRVDGLDTMPPSLREAIRAFVLTCAARLVRGQSTEHNSMLVHVTRFTAVQGRVTEQIRQELQHLQRQLKFGDGARSIQLRDELRQLWEDDFVPTSEAIAERNQAYGNWIETWDELQPVLEQAALSIGIRQINGQAGEVLDYIQHEGKGLNVIAVGGDKLSRGLTLEGLSVSYFLRASRMYDTLMQMGRWFGYRLGYLDLCRLYTTADLTEWYAHIASASEELRLDFNRMAASGGTPRDFGHRVKSHPLMLVTSQVKMRSGTTIDVTFAGDISETINFWRTKGRLASNWKAGEQLIQEIESAGIKPISDADVGPARKNWMWRGVSDAAIIDFLTAYREHEASRKVKTKLLADYIRMEVDRDRLTDWTVLVAPGSAQSTAALGTATFRMVERSWFLTEGRDEDARLTERQTLEKQNHYRIRRLVNPEDEGKDLDATQRATALIETKKEWEKDPGGRAEPQRPSGVQIRRVRPAKQGLLILYALDPADAGDKVHESGKVEVDAIGIPVLGFAISFPAVADEEASKVRYVVNNVYYTQEFGTPVDESEELV